MDDVRSLDASLWLCPQRINAPASPNFRVAIYPRRSGRTPELGDGVPTSRGADAADFRPRAPRLVLAGPTGRSGKIYMHVGWTHPAASEDKRHLPGAIVIGKTIFG